MYARLWGSVPLSPQVVRCPAVTASGTVQGEKGAVSSPGARWGNNSTPVRQVGDERGAGAHFLTRKLAVYAVDGERPGYGAPGVARRLFRAWRRRGPFWPPPRVVSGFSRAVCGVPSRSAPSRQMPGGHGFRDGTGVKGGCFLPGARWGNNSAPVRQVGDERGAGVLFV